MAHFALASEILVQLSDIPSLSIGDEGENVQLGCLNGTILA